MTVRRAWYAGPGRFYPSHPTQCRHEVEACLEAPADPKALAALPERLWAGIAPHAGWFYSGPTAGVTFRLLGERSRPETVVLLGAWHRGFGRADTPVIMTAGAWETPLGTVEIDEALATALVQAGAAEEDPSSHAQEHSLEVLTPFVKVCFAQARIVPILVLPTPTAHTLGPLIVQTAGRLGREIIVVASTDLTHYGPGYGGFEPAGSGPEARRWVREVNDRRLLDLIVGMQAEAVVPEALASHSACGAGAVAAAVAAARARGIRRGHVVAYTTSADAHPEMAGEDFVGYTAVVF